MKKLLLLAFLFVSVFANAQNIKNDDEPYEVYCAFHGQLQISGKFMPKGTGVILSQSEIPDADSRFLEGEHKNRNNIRDEQRDTIHIIPSA